MKFHLVLGNQAYSSWSLRGWLLFEAFGLECTHEVVPLWTDAFEQFERNHYPSLTVPTVLLNEGEEKLSVWDSLAITELLHEQFPQAGIWPKHILARAAARSLVAEMHSGFTHVRSTMPMNVKARYERFIPDSNTQREIDRITMLWDWARSRWGDEGPYLFGSNMSAADVFYAPVASRFRTYGIDLNSANQQYVDTLLAHPATVDFYQAGLQEEWVIEEYEFDIV
ncbi:MAG: glutathione S-transferase [Pseudomonadota bacterium]